ncbi:MAG: hypothetical protein ACRD3J_13420, partial [Thermoanaerobaculia bacterium]
MTGPQQDWLRDDVRKRFGLGVAQQLAPCTIGAELELIPRRADGGLPVLIKSHGSTSSLDVMRKVAGNAHWREIPAASDPPSWNLPSGARISFEPGGQIELSSA